MDAYSEQIELRASRIIKPVLIKLRALKATLDSSPALTEEMMKPLEDWVTPAKSSITVTFSMNTNQQRQGIFANFTRATKPLRSNFSSQLI